jgi:hypothetical protein
MNFTTYFSRQARKPAGIFGRFYMSRVFEKGNAELNALMYETLSIQENDHVWIRFRHRDTYQKNSRAFK